jgi:hypothetical protein
VLKCSVSSVSMGECLSYGTTLKRGSVSD